MRTRSKLFSFAVAVMALAMLLSGCASQYGEQITKVNYYPQCYKPISDLRQDENNVAKSTAVGAVGGALTGALVGGLATGSWKGAAAGAVAGGAAGAVAGNVYGKSKQKEKDAAETAKLVQQLDEDTAGMDRVTAAGKVARQCYEKEWSRAKAEYKNRIKISPVEADAAKKELMARYEEIRSGMQESIKVLTGKYDAMKEKDNEYVTLLGTDFTQPKPVAKKSRKASKGTSPISASVNKRGKSFNNLGEEKAQSETFYATLESDMNVTTRTGAV